MDGVELTGALAQTAADAGVGADLGNGGALVLVGAVDEHLLGIGDLHDQLPGAGLAAGAAVGALFLVHHGNAVFAHMDGVELTGGHTGAEAQAAVLAGQRVTGQDLGGGQTVVDAAILEVLHRIDAAVAQNVGHHLLAGGSCHAHDGSDLGSALGAGGSTGVDGGLAGQNGLSAAAAAGIAAAAAVGAGQTCLDLGQAGIHLYLKDLGGHRQDQAEHDGKSAKDHNGPNDSSKFHNSSSLPDLQAAEAHEGQSHQAGGDQRDGEALEGLGTVAGNLQLLADGGKQEDGQQEAQTTGDAVDHGPDEVVVILHVQQGDAQHGAVGGDQGQVHAQGGVQGGDVLLQEHFHELHQTGDDQDEGHGLHELQVQRDEDQVHQVAECGGQTHNEGHGRAHAHGGVDLLGHAQEGAAAQELGKDKVIGQDSAKRNGEQSRNRHSLLGLLFLFALGQGPLHQGDQGAQGQEAADRQSQQLDAELLGEDGDAGGAAQSAAAQQAAAELAGAQQLAEHAHDDQDDGIADALADAVHRGSAHRVLGGKGLGTAQDDAVHHDQGDEHAQGVGQGGNERLEQQVHAGNEAGDNHDEAGDTDLIGDDLAQQRDENVGKGQDDQHGHAHAQAVEERRGDGHGGAHTQQLHQHGVLGDQALFELLAKVHIAAPPFLAQSFHGSQGGVGAHGDALGGNGGTGDGGDVAAHHQRAGAGHADKLIQDGGTGGVGLVLNDLGADAGGLGVFDHGDAGDGAVGIDAHHHGDGALGAGGGDLGHIAGLGAAVGDAVQLGDGAALGLSRGHHIVGQIQRVGELAALGDNGAHGHAGLFRIDGGDLVLGDAVDQAQQEGRDQGNNGQGAGDLQNKLTGDLHFAAASFFSFLGAP